MLATSNAEARWIEDCDNACPYCGGSGHKGDTTVEAELTASILAELDRARDKFPGDNVTFAALIEEVGELSTALFEEKSDRVREEAIQVAVMAIRIILDGDHTFEPWRAAKGLDALDPRKRKTG